MNSILPKNGLTVQNAANIPRCSAGPGTDDQLVPMDQTMAIFRFGAYESRPRTRELYKHGSRLRIRVQPLQVLNVLLVTQTYRSPKATNPTFTSRAASAARQLRSNGIIVNWEFGFPTFRIPITGLHRS
jgi:hypothetical protein